MATRGQSRRRQTSALGASVDRRTFGRLALVDDAEDGRARELVRAQVREVRLEAACQEREAARQLRRVLCAADEGVRGRSGDEQADSRTHQQPGHEQGPVGRGGERDRVEDDVDRDLALRGGEREQAGRISTSVRRERDGHAGRTLWLALVLGLSRHVRMLRAPNLPWATSARGHEGVSVSRPRAGTRPRERLTPEPGDDGVEDEVGRRRPEAQARRDWRGEGRFARQRGWCYSVRHDSSRRRATHRRSCRTGRGAAAGRRGAGSGR